MKIDRRPLSCMDVCGQVKECGNKYCSANSHYVPPTPKNKKRAAKRRRNALHPRKTSYMGGGMRQSAY